MSKLRNMQIGPWKGFDSRIARPGRQVIEYPKIRIVNILVYLIVIFSHSKIQNLLLQLQITSVF